MWCDIYCHVTCLSVENVPDSIDHLFCCLVTESTPAPRVYTLPQHESQYNAEFGMDRQESPPMAEYTDIDRDTVRNNCFKIYILIASEVISVLG